MGSRRQMASIFKGWLYLSIGAAALLFLLWQFERRQPVNLPNDPAQPPAEGWQADVPTAKIEPVTLPNAETAAPLPADEAPPVDNQPPQEAMDPETTEFETPLAVEQSKTSDEAAPVQEIVPVQREDTTGVEPVEEVEDNEGSPIKTVDRETNPPEAPLPVESTAPESLIQDDYCAPLAADLLSATHTDEQFRWRGSLKAPATIYARTAGRIVKIYQHPVMGRTVYLHADDGRACLVFGGLDRLTPGLVVGQQVTRCAPLGEAQTTLYLEELALTQDQTWWLGRRRAPRAGLTTVPEPRP